MPPRHFLLQRTQRWISFARPDITLSLIHILPMFLGVTGVLWTGPVADGLAFIFSVILLVYERKQLHKIELAA